MTRILVTRPEPDAQSTAGRLEAIGIDPVILPLTSAQFKPFELPEIGALSGIILTSTNALRALDHLDLTNNFTHLPVFAVGDRTADEARHAGFSDITIAEGNAQSLIDLLGKQKPGSTLFYPAGTHISFDITQALAPTGQKVVTRTVYDMVSNPDFSDIFLTQWQSADIDGALFYSRRTAELFTQMVPHFLWPDVARNMNMLCLSENIAIPLREKACRRITLAEQPSENAILASALSFSRAQIG